MKSLATLDSRSVGWPILKASCMNSEGVQCTPTNLDLNKTPSLLRCFSLAINPRRGVERRLAWGGRGSENEWERTSLNSETIGANCFRVWVRVEALRCLERSECEGGHGHALTLEPLAGVVGQATTKLPGVSGFI